jgi:uncharacterized membrane protein
MAFSLTSILSLPDMLALGWFFLCWVGYAYCADQRQCRRRRMRRTALISRRARR